MNTTTHSRLYELSSRCLLRLLRTRRPASVLTWFSKVWLRQARIVQHLANGGYDAIVDGGASIGEFAALARLACPKASLLCVEPHPASAATLRRRGFTVVEAALWRERGTTTLTQPSAAATSCTVLASQGHARPSWTVETLRLDELPVHGNSVFVKLDLQGAESEALRGMDGLWDRCRGLLLEVSYGERGSYESIRAFLGARGYVEAATFNELETDAGVIEADKLWLRRPDR